MNIINLNDLGTRIAILSRTAQPSIILWDYNLPAWHMGGCCIFANALVSSLKNININSYLYVLMSDDIVQHFLVYVPDYNIFIDSEGSHKLYEAIKLLNIPSISLVRWDESKMNLGPIIYDINAIDRLKIFFDLYLNEPFTIIHDEDEYHLLSFKNNKMLLNNQEIDINDVINIIPENILKMVNISSQTYIEIDIH